MDGIEKVSAGIMFVGFMISLGTINMNLDKIFDALMLIAAKMP